MAMTLWVSLLYISLVSVLRAQLDGTLGAKSLSHLHAKEFSDRRFCIIFYTYIIIFTRVLWRHERTVTFLR